LNPMSSGRVLIAKLCLKKLQFLQRTRSEYEIREFFFNTLFELFDICVAPLDQRIKIYQLMDILDILFPGLPLFCQKQIDSTIFPELVSSESQLTN